MAPILERIALVVGSNVAPSRVSQSLTLWVWMSLLQHPLERRGAPESISTVVRYHVGPQ